MGFLERGCTKHIDIDTVPYFVTVVDSSGLLLYNDISNIYLETTWLLTVGKHFQSTANKR